MLESFVVGDIEVGKGTKKWASLKVAERSLAPINIPVTIVNGAKSGPVLCVLAGEHPNEYAGIETCIRLSKNVDPKMLSGKLIILPVVNVPGFERRSPYVCPLDGVNLSMSRTRWSRKPTYPSISYVMLYNIYHNVITKSDYLIRLHGGDMCESILPWYISSGQAKGR